MSGKLLGKPALLALAFAGISAQAQAPAGFAEKAAAQGAANAQPGPRHVPARVIPVPTQDVSPPTQAMIKGGYMPLFNADPKDAAEWKTMVNLLADKTIAELPALKAKLGVSVEPTKIAGVNAFMVTPKSLPPGNKDRLLVHVHGGAYVMNPREAGLPEAILLSGFGGYKVVSIDYRMPPDFPYPAGMDDAMAVWEELVKTHNPRKMAIFGTSAGGAMTLAMILRAKSEDLPLPAAIASGTPWSDIARIGDTYETLEWIDNALVSWDGVLGRAAKLYAAGHDLKDPQLSPIYGDFAGFPPTILTTGTRDLFLSNTVRTHRKLRQAGVVADLNVYEGQSHAQYLYTADAPETKEIFTDIARFFDTHLGQ